MKHCWTSLVITGITSLILMGCSTTTTATDWFVGDTLVLRVKEMRLVEEIRYSIEGEHYLIRPSREGRRLAAAHLEIQNSKATIAYFSVGKNSARLRDDSFLDYRVLAPFEEREKVEEARPGEDTILPFIWGDVALPSKCGEPGLESRCELDGWILFEVPSDIKFYQLIWEAGDAVYLRF